MMERRFMSTGSLLSSLFRDFDDDDFDEYRCLDQIETDVVGRCCGRRCDDAR